MSTQFDHHSIRILLPVCFAAAALALLAVGCSEEPAEPEPAPEAVSVSQANVMRLFSADEALGEAVEATPLQIPLSHLNVIAGPVETAELREDALVLPEADEAATVAIPVRLPAERYRALRVRMKVSAGDTAWYGWGGRRNLPDRACTWRTAAVESGDAFRDYTFPLEGAAWNGTIAELRLTPSEEAGAAAIASVSLLPAESTGPILLTLQDVTHPARSGSLPAWRVRVPERAQLHFNTAVQPPLGREGFGGATFRVLASNSTGQDVVLQERRLGQEEAGWWHAHRIDLSAWAGQELALRFEISDVSAQAADSCYWSEPIIQAPALAAEQTPVILISCDTLRADHLSCYGYERRTSPNLDALAEESVLFTNAVSEETWTLPGHMTMLTGLLPETHRVGLGEVLDSRWPTVMQLLAEEGYRTGGFTGHGPLLYPRHGFARGFDQYNTPHTFRDIFETMPLVDAWVEQQKEADFFLFFHNYDIHSKFPPLTDLPYFPPDEKCLTFSPEYAYEAAFRREGEPFFAGSRLLAALNEGTARPLSPEEHAYLIALYDDAIVGVDAALGNFFDRLKALELYDRALVIVTSDHGESFGEHDLYLHGDIYESCAHVPFIVKFPEGRFAGKHVDHLIELADIAPTILDTLGLPVPEGMEGMSLLALLEERADPREWTHLMRSQFEGIRMPDWKLILNTGTEEEEVYHVAEDPDESENLLLEGPPPLPVLRERIAEVYSPADAPGWHALLQQPESYDQEPSSFEFSWQADGGFAAHAGIGLEDGDIVEAREEGGSVAAMLALPPEDMDELVVLPTEGAAALAISSAKPFVLRFAGEQREVGGEWRETLSPDPNLHLSPPDRQRPRGDLPVLTLWFEPPREGAFLEQIFTGAELDHLGNIGYMPGD